MSLMRRALIGIGALLAVSVAHANDEIAIQNLDRDSWFWVAPTEIELKEHNAKSPPRFVFSDPASVTDCRFEDKPCDPGKPVTILVDLKNPKPTRLALTFRMNGKEKEIGIHVFEKVAPDFKISGQSAIEKNILISPWNYAMVLSPRGEVVYYRDFGFPVQDFRPQIVNGQLFYSIMHLTQGNIDVNSVGTHLILDRNFKVIEKTGKSADGHEFFYLGPRHYLFLFYRPAQTPAGTCYIDQIASEELDGKVINKFSAYDFQKAGYLPEMAYKRNFEGRLCSGNFHLNSVQIVDKSHWLISFGNGSIIMWNLQSRKADWIFSGPEDQFDLAPEQITHLHHTPYWFAKEKRLVLFDNDYVGQTSRLLDFKLDPIAKNVIGFQQIKLKNGYASYGGSVEAEGATTYSVGFGMRHTGIWDFAEIENGKTNMTAVFQKQTDGPYSYRIYRAAD